VRTADGGCGIQEKQRRREVSSDDIRRKRPSPQALRYGRKAEVISKFSILYKIGYLIDF